MKIKKYKQYITENSDLATGSIGKKKFKVKGYRTWDEARPEGIIETDEHKDIIKNFKDFEEALIKQDDRFEGADLESVEEMPNNI